MDLIGRISALVSTTVSGPLPVPTIVDFGADGSPRSKQTDTIEPFKHYFRFDINQMYIAKGREFWIDFDPLVTDRPLGWRSMYVHQRCICSSAARQRRATSLIFSAPLDSSLTGKGLESFEKM